MYYFYLGGTGDLISVVEWSWGRCAELQESQNRAVRKEGTV